MFDGIIFDMDGLMVDTERIMQKELRKILKQMGYPPDENVILSLIGLTDRRTQEALKKAFGEQFDYDVFLKLLLERKKIAFHEEEIGVKKGLIELLEYLKKENIKSIVATGSVREHMNFILQKTELLQYFDLFVCGDEVEQGKPFPDIFLKAAEKLEVAAERCLILEDSQNGIIAANNAGIPVIFIKDLVTPEKQYMEQIYAECNDLSEVIKYLK